MITDAANSFADYIIKQAKYYEDRAKNCAVEYAQTDNPSYKESFESNMRLKEEYYILHGLACQAMHKIESEMTNRLKEQK